MFKTTSLLVAISLSATACIADDKPVGDTATAYTPASQRSVAQLPPLTKQQLRPLRIDGSYRVVSRWDLSSAIAGDSLGDTLATLMIAQAAGSLGLPSWWEDDAEDALSALAHDPLASFIDGNTPDIVGGSDGLLAQLDAIFSNVEVTSRITLTTSDDGTSVTGSQQVLSVRLSYDGQSVDIPVAQLSGSGTVVADVSASVVARDRLSVAEHSFVLRADPLAAIGLDGLLSISDISAYAAQAIDCNAIVASLTGGNGLTLSFAGQSVSVGEGTLVSACESVRGEALDLVLGFFDTELGVATGGPLLMHDDAGNGEVDRLFAAAGYTGVVESLPESVQAPFAIELTGNRE